MRRTRKRWQLPSVSAALGRSAQGVGDVLTKQDHTKEALVKYDEALKYAPNWKQLKEAREACREVADRPEAAV